MANRKLISKSSYLIYRQCPKYFWYYINDKKSIPGHDPRAKFNFKIGHIIGNLAKLRYKDGIEAGIEGNLDDNLKRTRNLLDLRKPLFGAGFVSREENVTKQAAVDLYARADILVPANGSRPAIITDPAIDPVSDCPGRFPGKSWDIVEVKSSTGVKAVTIYDVAFQKYCYLKAGLDIRNVYVMHINSEYIRNGELDPFSIFKLVEVSEEVDRVLPHIKNDLRQMMRIISSDDIPETGVGKFCDSPFNCPLKARCWEHVSDKSIFYLYSITNKIARRMNDCGIEYIHEIPEGFSGINYKQKIQIDCVKNSRSWVDKPAIADFLNKIEYPLYFLDFETFASPVPLIENTRPYQNIPFQFSLHIARTPECSPEHFSFLADGKSDPRKELTEALKEKLGVTSGEDGIQAFTGSVIVYDESFERSVLRDLAAFNSSDTGWIFMVASRIVDLFDPFKNFYFYDVSQKGSASIKKVLPSLTEKSYKDLPIANGDIASISFLEGSALWKDFISANNPGTTGGRENIVEEIDEQIKTIRQNLEDYCKLDTEGLYHILQKLKKLA